MFEKSKVVMLSTNEKASQLLCKRVKDVFGKSINDSNLELTNNQTYINNCFLMNSGKAATNSQSKTEFYHLYFLSDKEIQEGYTGKAIVTVKDDTRIHYLIDVIATEKGQCYCSGDKKFSFEYYSVRAIIATTDSSLMFTPTNNSFGRDNFLPQPSQLFMEIYAETYTKGKQITEVMVKYEECNPNNFVANESIAEVYAMNNNGDYDILYNQKLKQLGGKQRILLPKVNPKDNTITIKLIKDSWDREEIPYLLVDLCWKYQTEKNYNALDFDTNKNDFVKWIKENL